jgi:hypothetical protein
LPVRGQSAARHASAASSLPDHVEHSHVGEFMVIVC